MDRRGKEMRRTLFGDAAAKVQPLMNKAVETLEVIYHRRMIDHGS